MAFDFNKYIIENYILIILFSNVRNVACTFIRLFVSNRLITDGTVNYNDKRGESFAISKIISTRACNHVASLKTQLTTRRTVCFYIRAFR